MTWVAGLFVCAILIWDATAGFGITAADALGADTGGKRVEVSGRVMASRHTSTGISLEIAADSIGGRPAEGYGVAVLWQTLPDVMPAAGDRVRFRSALKAVRPVRDVDEEIDHDALLLRRGIAARAIVGSPDGMAVERRHSLASAASRLGDRLAESLDRLPVSGECVALLRALICGDRSEMSDETRREFAIAGVGHLLALSGTHVAIISMLVNWLLWPLAIWGGRRLRMSAVIAAVWVYAAVTGLGPSVTRSAVMVTVFGCGAMMERPLSPFNSLMTAAALLLLADPLNLFDVGCQLSFAAVGAILMFGGAFNPLVRRGGWLGVVTEPLVVTLAATAGTAMIAACYFHYVPAYFLPANLALAPAVPWLIGGGLATAALTAVGIDAGPFCQALDLIAGWIHGVASFIAGLPGSALDGIYFSAWAIAPYALFIICVRLYLGRRRRTTAVAAIAGLGATVGIIAASPAPPDRGEWIVSRAAGSEVAVIIADPADSVLRVYATGARHHHPAVAARIASRYRDYMARRGYRGVEMIAPDDTSSRYIPDPDVPLLAIGADTLCFARRHRHRQWQSATGIGTSLRSMPHITHMIVGPEYKGNVADTYYGMDTSADTVVAVLRELPPDVPSGSVAVEHSFESPLPFRRAIRF